MIAMCEPIAYKVWEPRRLTTLWASTACYMDTFTFFGIVMRGKSNVIKRNVATINLQL
jgi:hypothetical protein